MGSRGHIFLKAVGETHCIGINGIMDPQTDMDISGVLQIRDRLQFTETAKFKTLGNIDFTDISNNCH